MNYSNSRSPASAGFCEGGGRGEERVQARGHWAPPQPFGNSDAFRGRGRSGDGGQGRSPTCHLASQETAPKALVTGLSPGRAWRVEQTARTPRALSPPDQHSFLPQRTRPAPNPRPPQCSRARTLIHAHTHPTRSRTPTHSRMHAQSAPQPPARPHANDRPAEHVLTLTRPHPIPAALTLRSALSQGPRRWGRGAWRRAG